MKSVCVTSSIATGDLYPEYSMMVVDDAIGEEYINRVKRKRKELSLMEMDQMTDKEIEEWYARNGKYAID